MLRIAITSPDIRHDECEYISTILDAGWDRVHLRHPSVDREDMRKILDGLSPHHRSLVKLHSHFDLAIEYGLCGIHLNSRHSIIPPGFCGEISKSLHSLHELEELKDNKELAYVTLSPIFDSLSKHRYHKHWDKDRLHQSLTSIDTPVIALGGIKPDKRAWLKTTGFAGYAVLGYLNKAESISELCMRLHEFDSYHK